jgi:carbon-monoxide dehydrogenase medium subunit
MECRGDDAVKPPPFEYEPVETVDEALALLAENAEDAKILAGGQSLMPVLALRLTHPEMLIDINRVEPLATWDARDGLRIGTLVRHRVAERAPGFAAANPLLASAARYIGHAAIRNRGTIGGSVAHADPAAELPAALVALDGEIECVSRRGTRTVPAADFFLGYLTTALEPDELLSAVVLPPWTPGSGWSFQEFSRRSGDFAIAGAAVVLRLGTGGAVAEARIALSGMSDTPVRASKAEATLIGQRPSDELWAAAASDAVADLDPPADLHGSTSYRRHVAATMVRDALREARLRAEAGA